MLMKYRDDEYRETQLTEEDIPFIQDELDNVTTVLYVLIEGARNFPLEVESARSALCMYLFDVEDSSMLTTAVKLSPRLVDYFLTITARLRWDDANELPQTRARYSASLHKVNG